MRYEHGDRLASASQFNLRAASASSTILGRRDLASAIEYLCDTG
jgi:hypothetical protein